MTKIIQVGLGFWGFDWASTVIPRVPDIEVVAYVDPSEAARTRAATELKVFFFQAEDGIRDNSK